MKEDMEPRDDRRRGEKSIELWWGGSQEPIRNVRWREGGGGKRDAQDISYSENPDLRWQPESLTGETLDGARCPVLA
jgi:hypothetical protein